MGFMTMLLANPFRSWIVERITDEVKNKSMRCLVSRNYRIMSALGRAFSTENHCNCDNNDAKHPVWFHGC
jgi:hypothetical protein